MDENNNTEVQEPQVTDQLKDTGTDPKEDKQLDGDKLVKKLQKRIGKEQNEKHSLQDQLDKANAKIKELQSGKSINYNGPISKRGNRNARKILFITCCSIIRSSVLHNIDTDILVYYRKKQAENKHFKECITACSTKLLRIIFAMCKNNSLYVQK